VIVAESYGGNDEPVDTLMANMVGVGAEVGDKPWGAGENSTHGWCGCCGEGEVVSHKRSCLVKIKVTGGGGRHMMGACAAVKKKY
jgi:hypothetical protein